MRFDDTKLILPLVKRALFKTKFSAIIDVTDKCNLHCPHCYHKNFLQDNDDVTLEEWERRFKYYYKNGVRVVFLTGGEPTLRMDVVELAYNFFPFVAVYTNGLIRIPDAIDCSIFLSLDGLETEHDSLRGSGVFKSAVANYLNDDRVVVYSILSQATYKGRKKLKEFIDLVGTMNTRGLKFDFFVPQTDTPDSYYYLLPDNTVFEIGKVIQEKKEEKRVNIIFDWSIFKRQVHKNNDRFKCTIQTANYVIAANGNLKRCASSHNDCRFCRTDRNLYVPFWQIRDWKKLKKIRREYF